MKRKRERILLLLLATLLLLSACGGKKQACQNVLDEFEYACNELDVDAMLRCVNPRIADPIRLGLALFTNLTDTEVEDLVDQIASALIDSTDETDVNAEDLFQSMKMETTKIKVKGRNAAAYVNIQFQTLGVDMEKYGKFDLVKVNDTWYIDCFTWLDNSYK